jgi:HAD superfamily hydrolase (TIGR01509 family)
MLQAIIFDFNAVICNDEPVHLKALQKILREEDIHISDGEYASTYLGKDDKQCFQLAFQRKGRPLTTDKIESLIRRKSDDYLREVANSLCLFPGVVSFVEAAHRHYELAIASGALRREILFVLDRFGLGGRFRCVVAADDIERGKPEPEIFLKALEAINLLRPQDPPILPRNCLVIEDSVPGIKAALAAGMRCLAVTNSHSADELAAADQVVASLELDPSILQNFFET